MMNKKLQNPARSRKVTVRFTIDEYDTLEGRWKNSLCQKLSDYVRSVIFNQPIVKKYRNQSLDEFMAEMIVLRAELNHIGNNFNQAVKRLHTLRDVAEIPSWLTRFEGDKQRFEDKAEQINRHIKTIAESWLQR